MPRKLSPDLWLFGSELKALLVHPALRRDIDPLAVEEYFAYGYVPDPRTVFKGVFKLPPGCTLRGRRGRLCIRGAYRGRQMPGLSHAANERG